MEVSVKIEVTDRHGRRVDNVTGQCDWVFGPFTELADHVFALAKEHLSDEANLA